jgi:hypothetical protein
MASPSPFLMFHTSSFTKHSNPISQNIQEICLQEDKIWNFLPKLDQTGNSAVWVCHNTVNVSGNVIILVLMEMVMLVIQCSQ